MTTRGMFDAQCPKCRTRISWVGTLADKPPCRKCGWKQDPETLARDNAHVEGIMQHARECDGDSSCPICAGRKNEATIGDKGQQYEVIQIRRDHSRMTWGWTNLAGGGKLADAVRRHPDTLSVDVRDRFQIVKEPS